MSMYAIAFDMSVDSLKTHYGENYSYAYKEIEKELLALGFEWAQGSLYLSKDNSNTISQIFKAVDTLRKIEWFRNSVRDVRAFKVEDFSDLTEIIKQN